jgi:hypothetical protein
VSYIQLTLVPSLIKRSILVATIKLKRKWFVNRVKFDLKFLQGANILVMNSTNYGIPTIKAFAQSSQYWNLTKSRRVLQTHSSSKTVFLMNYNLLLIHRFQPFPEPAFSALKLNVLAWNIYVIPKILILRIVPILSKRNLASSRKKKPF